MVVGSMYLSVLRARALYLVCDLMGGGGGWFEESYKIRS